MERGRGSRNPFFAFGDPFEGPFGGPFAGFGGFGGQRSLISSFFGGGSPFDDPFFQRPFGSMFQSNFFGPTESPFLDTHASGFLEHQHSQPNRSRGPVIEELDSDDEKEAAEGSQVKQENSRKHGRHGKEPFVDEPDDEAEERKRRQMLRRNEVSSMNHMRTIPQDRSFTFQSSTVTYGGANGAYYTSSSTRRTGNDGLTFEEHKEANSATGQAAHQLSKGIYDKGHTVARKLSSDGRVDMVQTLHNINEDELPGFEEAWNGNARKHLPGYNGSGAYSVDGRKRSGSLALPSNERNSCGTKRGNFEGGGSGAGDVDGRSSSGGWVLPLNEHYSRSTKPIVDRFAGSSKVGGRDTGNSSRGLSGAGQPSKMDGRRS